MPTVGSLVRALRMARHFRNAGDFAKKAGVSPQWLSDLENDRVALPEAQNLMKIAAALPCLVDELLHGIGDAAFDETRQAALALLAGQASELATIELMDPSKWPLVKALPKLGADDVPAVMVMVERLIAAQASASRTAGRGRGAGPAKRKAAGKKRVATPHHRP
jgi:transcriptional regulator with XRE-family HTH domain